MHFANGDYQYNNNFPDFGQMNCTPGNVKIFRIIEEEEIALVFVIDIWLIIPMS